MSYVLFLGLLALVLLAVGVYHTHKKLPGGLSWEGTEYPGCTCAFLRDLTWIDAQGGRHTDQQIMDAVLALIRGAQKIILMDMFLFNDFSGTVQAGTRPLAREVTTALLARKKDIQELRIILITDPVNTVYGGLVNPYLAELRSAGITVVSTDLDPLRDSNILYSPLWRVLVRPFGTGRGVLLPNPFGQGRVSVRSYLRLLNFKANHRKLIVADSRDGYSALVTSFNPHDGSSAHGNVALRFSGPAVQDILACERSVPGMVQDVLPACSAPIISPCPDSDVRVQVLTEGRIKKAVLAELGKVGGGDRVDLVMFYLADRQVVRAMIKAKRRGARLRVLLDPNKDAFGRVKNGIPNRQAAAVLVGAGVAVRWANTRGEQLHAKMVLVERAGGEGFLLLGSANFTRRNLDDYNLELDVAVRGTGQARPFLQARCYVDLLWENRDQRLSSLDYERYADTSIVRRTISRWQEATGMSTF